ncbi:MAG: hypothetical protein CVV24_02915 [Ignavibacteriae bacterium HGW-Ignavibacteriae-3]|nr:MAG: hypothetical protein CVV24_02915 [Ignavibacteriae bacterium HGW-Ignavibacteriae-3]
MKKMLVVDDDSLSQVLMSKIFGKEFDVDLCGSAEEYSDRYSNTLYDIIIMDISLKGNKDGFDLIKEIKTDPLRSGTQILCLTANAQNSMRLTAEESGADLFVTKPVANEKLKEAVSFLINLNP